MDADLIANLATKTALAVAVFLAVALLAERAGAFMAGLLMTFPANSGAGFALIMFEQPREFLSTAALVSFAMTGPILVFMSAYVVASRWFGFLLALGIALALWWVGAVLVLKFESTLPHAFASAAVGVLIAIATASRGRPPAPQPQGPTANAWWPTIARAVLGGAMIAAVAFLSGTIGPTWSGLLLAFPTLMCGSAWILSRRFGDRFAAETLAKSKIALLSYASFNLALHYAAGPLSGPQAVGVCTLLAVAVSACVAYGRHAGSRR
ncbi:MAG: hypothetical protein ACR2PI_12625 [Hyphomicrobiaceae bacterium]